MANLWLGYTNRIEEATVASAGGYVATLPITNIRTRPLAQVAKASAAGAQTIDITFPSARAIRAIALLNHNLGSGETWSAACSNVALGNTDIYSSGAINAWSMTFDGDLIEFSSNDWWAGAATTEYTGHPYMAHHFISAVKTAKYVRLSISTGLTLQLGRVWIGNGLAPVYNASYGLQDGWIDLSSVETTDSGAIYHYPRRRQRRVRFVLDWINQTSEFATLYEMLRRQGTVNEVLYIPDTADAAHSQRTGFVGRLRELSPIEYPRPNTRSVALELVELL